MDTIGDIIFNVICWFLGLVMGLTFLGVIILPFTGPGIETFVHDREGFIRGGPQKADSIKYREYTQQTGSGSIKFSLYATDMTGCDSNSKCDLYVIMYCASSNSDWQRCGETSIIQDDNDPEWPEVFEQIPGTAQRWRFDVIDVDGDFDDIVSKVEVNVGEFLKQSWNLHRVRLPENSGIL